MKIKLTINKVPFSLVCLTLLLCASCTNTPWHRQQSELFLNKGTSYIEIGQYNNALKELLEANKYYSGNPKIHYFLGISYRAKDMRDKAIEEFKEAISLKEDYSEAHNDLGVIYSVDMKLWDKAIKEFDKALLNPIYDTPAVPLYNAGWAYYSKKDYGNALAKYSEALNKEPFTVLRPQIEKHIGVIYFEQNNIPEAIRHFKKSLELNSSLFDAQFFLGECYLKIKDNKNAKQAFVSVVKLSPQSFFGQRAKTYLQSLK